MSKYLSPNNKKIVVIYVLVLLILVIVATTYATKPMSNLKSIMTKTIRIDEEAYGKVTFDSSSLDLRPILDKNIEENKDNIVHIEFKVGGAKVNNVDNIVYDIALADLKLDCNLLSPYLKWILLKNGEVLSNGSFDYKFDTIQNGRLVLTPIQQDLKAYSEDKTTYDNYDFYMWLSDSCQSDNLLDCINAEDQSNLSGKIIQGKIEVELYAGTKKTLIRKPTEEVNQESCVVRRSEENAVSG